MPLRVLIVEDDPPSLELMTEILSSEGFHVLPVRDSRQAPEPVSGECFDGMFLDLQMPNLDGFDLLQLNVAGSVQRTDGNTVSVLFHDLSTREQKLLRIFLPAEEDAAT